MYKNRITTLFCNSPLESSKLEQYWKERRGLLFCEFNTTYNLNGQFRTLDAIRFPEAKAGAFKASGNYEEIRQLIKQLEVELIEVHKWGFYGFGQLMGKSAIVERYWEPKKVKKILITLGPKEFHPNNNPDPPTEEVFKKYGIEIFIPK